MNRKFDDLPWKDIVEAMGGHLGPVQPGRVHLGISRNGRYQDLIIGDNGGEVNISEVAPHVPPGKDYQYSVPYDCSARVTQPGALTLASWLLHRLDGETPDYDLDLDKVVEAPAEPKKPTTEDLVAAVKDHARKNYEKGGWDFVVECYEDKDLAGIIEEARVRSVSGAIKVVGRIVRAQDDRRRDIQNA